MDEEVTKVKIMDLDPTQFKFRPVKMKSKFRELFVDLQNLVVKFGKLRVPFDSRINTFGQSEISMYLGDTYTKKYSSEDLINKIKSIDNYIQETAKKENWLQGFPSGIRYNPILKESQNSNFAPTIKVKLSKNRQEIISKFYDENKNVIEFDNEQELLALITKGTIILSGIEFAGIFFNDKTWGMTCKIYNAQILPCDESKNTIVEEPVKVVDFLDSSDSETELECVLE
jgi:hypothetical protein